MTQESAYRDSPPCSRCEELNMEMMKQANDLAYFKRLEVKRSNLFRYRAKLVAATLAAFPFSYACLYVAIRYHRTHQVNDAFGETNEVFGVVGLFVGIIWLVGGLCYTGEYWTPKGNSKQ